MHVDTLSYIDFMEVGVNNQSLLHITSSGVLKPDWFFNPTDKTIFTLQL